MRLGTLSKAPTGWLNRWREENESTIEDWRRSIYRFRRNTLSVVGLSIVLFVVVVALFGAFHIVPFPEDGDSVHMEERLQAPSASHLFGTDEVGRDIFSRVIMATPVSLLVGVIVLVIAIGIGVPLGAIAGFWGGWVNDVIMRITDVFFTLPGLVLAIAIAASLGPGITNAMFAIALVWWPSYTRLMQGTVMSLRETDYVAAAEGLGASRMRIIFLHILPNTTSPIIVKGSMDIGFAILTTAALGFIGVGAKPPMPELGSMIGQGRSFLPTWWWYPTFPGLAIFIIVVGFNLLGDGLRDLMDPRARR